ncbi:MAG TPA: hypothetical protein PKM88_03375 [bacterium]|nr:hypothetical protein [bacterium]
MADTGTWRGRAAHLAPDRDWVLKMLRYNPATTQDPEAALREVDSARAALVAVAQPQAWWRAFPALTVADDTVAAGEFAVASAKLAEHLAGCTALTLLAVSLGPGTDALAAQLLKEHRYACAVAADAWGSAFVEAAADLVCGQLAAAQAGEVMRPRFSPGYGDWPQTDNARLLPLLPGCPVHANAAGMLTPQKSITALIGWSC